MNASQRRIFASRSNATSNHRMRCYATLAILLLVVGSGGLAQGEGVCFDVLPVVPANPLAESSAASVKRLRLPLKISTLIDVGERTEVAELYVEAQFTDRQITVVDYSPQTELASEIEGPIEVCLSDEKSRSLGVSANGIYAGVSGQAGADTGSKKIDSQKYRRLPEQRAIIASGTLNRGNAVYFKFRTNANHSLEGDKLVTIDIEVPLNWRAGAVELSISADGFVKPSLGLGSVQRARIGHQRFLVGVHLADDVGARRACWQMAEAESRLRRSALDHAASIEERAWPTVFHQLGAKLDIVSPEIPNNWLQRSLFERVDPHFDTQIRSLPVDVRVAVLDFLDAKQQITSMSGEVSFVQTRDVDEEIASLN